jgi:hypothetical protein
MPSIHHFCNHLEGFVFQEFEKLIKNIFFPMDFLILFIFQNFDENSGMTINGVVITL